MKSIVEDPLIALGLLAGLSVALEVGFRLGRRAARDRDIPGSGQIGAIQGALLGLLGLLLGFSFAAAGARFLERQDLIVQESNAIGTAYLRADLLDDAHRARLRDSLRRYTAHRIEAAKTLRHGLESADAAQIAGFHDEIWAAARDGVKARPDAALLVVPAVNDVIDLHSLRVAAGLKHLPLLVMFLLVVCSLLSVADIGYGNGLSGSRRYLLTAPLVVVVAVALWITVDLDHPRAGLLQLNDAPLEALSFPDR